jgi:hypothetical protein
MVMASLLCQHKFCSGSVTPLSIALPEPLHDNDVLYQNKVVVVHHCKDLRTQVINANGCVLTSLDPKPYSYNTLVLCDSFDACMSVPGSIPYRRRRNALKRHLHIQKCCRAQGNYVQNRFSSLSFSFFLSPPLCSCLCLSPTQTLIQNTHAITRSHALGHSYTNKLVSDMASDKLVSNMAHTRAHTLVQAMEVAFHDNALTIRITEDVVREPSTLNS